MPHKNCSNDGGTLSTPLATRRLPSTGIYDTSCGTNDHAPPPQRRNGGRAAVASGCGLRFMQRILREIGSKRSMPSNPFRFLLQMSNLTNAQLAPRVSWPPGLCACRSYGSFTPAILRGILQSRLFQKFFHTQSFPTMHLTPSLSPRCTFNRFS